MSYMQWGESLRVGVKDVDHQHQQLVSLINELHSAMLEGRGSAVMASTITALIDYTVSHFGTEEAYFDAHGYPKSSQHKAQHAEFVRQVEDFRRGLEEGQLMVSIDVLDFLSNWLVEHIQGSDRAFGPFLNECGVS